MLHIDAIKWTASYLSDLLSLHKHIQTERELEKSYLKLSQQN